MPNYQNGKIYKITAGNLTYYGSTTVPLSRRLAKHRDEKKFKPNSNVSSFPLLDMPDCKIILVEDYPCERREQLLAREAFYIESNECVNKIRPFRTEEQKMQAKREGNSRYYYKYHEKCLEQKRLYKLRKKNNLELQLIPEPAIIPVQEPTPKPKPEHGQSNSARWRERQNRIKLISQSKITFTS
jgi:hypothetical protein